jgi:hypothetical protein
VGGTQVNWKLTILPAVALLALTGVCFGGLGEPLSSESPEEALRTLKSSELYGQAVKSLKEMGFSQKQADVALEKMPREHLNLIASELTGAKAGGYYLYFWDLLLFVLFVALIVWLIIVLIEAPRGGYYGRRYR